ERRTGVRYAIDDTGWLHRARQARYPGAAVPVLILTRVSRRRVHVALEQAERHRIAVVAVYADADKILIGVIGRGRAVHIVGADLREIGSDHRARSPHLLGWGRDGRRTGTHYDAARDVGAGIGIDGVLDVRGIRTGKHGGSARKRVVGRGRAAH